MLLHTQNFRLTTHRDNIKRHNKYRVFILVKGLHGMVRFLVRRQHAVYYCKTLSYDMINDQASLWKLKYTKVTCSYGENCLSALTLTIKIT